ncbi:hypothetical protein [Acidovorax temperans]|uniref:hypothetical protein n=1 Tax=Acidovorax temperans TaxID=80878 RepID=UPI00289F841B|nr:hypothetical protein [Acidovorax temperans]
MTDQLDETIQAESEGILARALVSVHLFDDVDRKQANEHTHASKCEAQRACAKTDKTMKASRTSAG